MRRWKRGERAREKARLEAEGEALYQKYKDVYATLTLEPEDVLAHVRSINGFSFTRKEEASLELTSKCEHILLPPR